MDGWMEERVEANTPTCLWCYVFKLIAHNRVPAAFFYPTHIQTWAGFAFLIVSTVAALV